MARHDMIVISFADTVRLSLLVLLGVAAYRDIQTRRVPNYVWFPFLTIGGVIFGYELVQRFSYFSSPWVASLPLGVVTIVSVIGYIGWRQGLYGGADAKAIISLAVLFPDAPSIYVDSMVFPLTHSLLNSFSITILTNAVVLSSIYPLLMLINNINSGNLSLPSCLLARRHSVDEIENVHGTLYHSIEESLTPGLDLDALRMYLRWRGSSLSTLVSSPSIHRDPDSIRKTFPATDGRIDVSCASAASSSAPEIDARDSWGAAAFLNAVGPAYGTTPMMLRTGLERLSSNDTVWVSPGIPFLVPLFMGTILALTAGNILIGLLSGFGLY
jgi:preflagellin peptidase FlaK